MAKCKYCRKPKAPFRAGLSSFCDIECAIAFAKKKAPEVRAKIEKNNDRERLAILNQTVTHWRPKAQNAFNRFIRLRDHDKPCISCGKTGAEISDKDLITGSRWDCGHYLSVGAAPELRFTEDNAHKQCTRCNSQLSGNSVKYRINLVKRIGQYRVDILEGPHEIPRWKWWHYEAVYNYYNTLNLKLKKEICKDS